MWEANQIEPLRLRHVGIFLNHLPLCFICIYHLWLGSDATVGRPDTDAGLPLRHELALVLYLKGDVLS